MKKLFNIISLLVFPLVLGAQNISYQQYMQSVAEKNIDYLAEKYHVDIAVANLKAAKVFNDPELSVDYGNNQDWFMEMGQSLEMGLSYDLDLAGVRRARIRSAMSEKEMAEASVAAFLSNLRLEAATAWVEAWSLRESVKVLEASVEDMMQIAKSDSIRLSVGDIGRIDAAQSRLEALTLNGELMALKAEYMNALRTLSLFCGGEPVTGLADDSLPQGNVHPSDGDLYEMAELNRADLKAAELSKRLSGDNLAMVKASRAFEMGLSLGYSYNTEVRNEIAPAPQFNGLSVGVTIPLKFSSLNRGELNAARSELLQSEKYYESARLQVQNEVAQALNSLEAAQLILEQFDSMMLDDAKDIVESRKIGYLRGESSLLEMLSAQQTFRDTMQAYIDASANCCLMQLGLDYAVGAGR